MLNEKDLIEEMTLTFQRILLTESQEGGQGSLY